MPTELSYNQIVLEMLRMSVKPPQVFCHLHEEREIEFYCMDHDELLCGLCVWEHSDHKNRVKVCTVQDIKKHTDLVKKSLDSMHEDIMKKV